MIKPLRYLWASPCTFIGGIFAVLLIALGGQWRSVSGIIEVALPAWANALRWRFSAITFGHIVLGVSMSQLEQLRPHELVHVQQYERWGIGFFLAYPLSSLAQLLRGRHPYWDNYFEIQAREISGVGYNLDPALKKTNSL